MLQSFLTKLLYQIYIFSIAVRAAVLAKLVVLGILHLTSCILVLRAIVVAKLIMLSILI